MTLLAVLAACGGGGNGPADAGPDCSSGLSACDGTCTDTLTDGANCGSCGVVCGTGTVCVNGGCVATCGDGVKADSEACDDHNTGDGDGCSATCEIETGWSCMGSPSECTTGCGDGIIAGMEACDDGDNESGDGCSAACGIEEGFTCTGAPSVCTTTCGDSIVAGDEACDDGDTDAGDGCSDVCQIEPGFTCAGAPSVCVTTCGDGIIAGAETCDDGDPESGDGCSGVCQVESGFNCDGEPSVCATTCGDGIVAGTEACDDRDTQDGDGCSATCTLERGFTCTGNPSVCVTTCGDGIIAGQEECDDNGNTVSDGCSASCRIEPGWTCTGEPSACVTTCGDGIVAGGEYCDDDNTDPGDGCSDQCSLEPGWMCSSGSPSVCVTICGDGFIVGPEQCDDNNTQPGDGCDTSCTVEPGFTCTGAPSNCAAICGDGLIVGNETCDDQGTTAGDGCSATCAVETGFNCTGAPSTCAPAITCPAGSSFVAFAAGDLPKPLNNSTPTAQSDIVANAPGVVTRVGVRVDVTHVYDGDLDLSFTGPNGVTIDLSSDNGSSNDDYTGTVFVDTATTAITSGSAPFTGQFKPEQPLAPFEGLYAQGTWSLLAVDDYPSADHGTLTGYELYLCVCTDCEFGAACGDTVDNDDDGLIDCADPDCALEAVCAVCGDGAITGAESCDDNNTTPGDGCDASCAIEAGYTCSGTPSACSPICGDGLIRGAEQCDDDGTSNGDGCSATCTIETGFACAGEPSVCDGICGDGMIRGSETCDDQGTVAGDGCSPTCGVEAGHECSGEPSACTPYLVCSPGSTLLLMSATDLPKTMSASLTTTQSEFVVTHPGVVTGAGASVDITHSYVSDLELSLISPAGTSVDLSSGNGGSNDHYRGTIFLDSAPTAITSGSAPFTGKFRPEEPLATVEGQFAAGTWALSVHDTYASLDHGTVNALELYLCVCADCEIGEACGDSVDNDNDGQIDCADPDCATAAACAVCGDGVVAINEECDDGNATAGDGCDASCAVEPGFACTGSPSTCAGICGDGLVRGMEQCDDDNTANGDGCDANCQLETGFSCSGEPTVCTATCGDGLVRGSETCDDQNTSDGDGCSQTCSIEVGYECNGEPTACSPYVTCPAGATVATFSATDVPVTFTDTAPGTSVIQVPNNGVVLDVAVGVSITHLWVEDIDLSLISPAGTTLDLTSDNGGDKDHYTDTWFVDSAATSITDGTAPFTGRFRPETPLSTLFGEFSAGAWSLYAEDDESLLNGTVTAYHLQMCICTDCEFGAACADTVDNDGDGLIDCADADCSTAPACQP